MIRSILMGVVAGMRSMTPLAALSWAAGQQIPSGHTSALPISASPTVSKITLALAAAELLGDKMRSAPNRTVAPGILARVTTGAIAGAAVAPSQDRRLGAVLGATVAVGAGYLTLALRKSAIRRTGQTSSGLIEDALALVVALGVVHAQRQDDRA